MKITKGNIEVNIVNGVIKTEQDAINHIKYIIKWYKINHLMSPVPAILQEVIDLSGLNFNETVEKLMNNNDSKIKVSLYTGLNLPHKKSSSTVIPTVKRNTGSELTMN